MAASWLGSLPFHCFARNTKCFKVHLYSGSRLLPFMAQNGLAAATNCRRRRTHLPIMPVLQTFENILHHPHTFTGPAARGHRGPE